ncbi:hypothetical protein [Nocardia africana]
MNIQGEISLTVPNLSVHRFRHRMWGRVPALFPKIVSAAANAEA